MRGTHGSVGASTQLLLHAAAALGVVACITPWNFPVAIPIWKIAPPSFAATPWSSAGDPAARMRLRPGSIFERAGCLRGSST